jgi:hypothetical protein
MASPSTTLASSPTAAHATPVSPAMGASATLAATPACRATDRVAAASGSSASACRGTLRRRRLVAVVVLLALSILLTVSIGRVGAEAELADPSAGHAVVAPGDTLWDIAVDTAPNGVDPREQLASIQDLNGLNGSAVDPWTVLLLPAR